MNVINMYIVISGLGNVGRKSRKGKGQSSVTTEIRKYRRKAGRGKLVLMYLHINVFLKDWSV